MGIIWIENCYWPFTTASDYIVAYDVNLKSKIHGLYGVLVMCVQICQGPSPYVVFSIDGATLFGSNGKFSFPKYQKKAFSHGPRFGVKAKQGIQQ